MPSQAAPPPPPQQAPATAPQTPAKPIGRLGKPINQELFKDRVSLRRCAGASLESSRCWAGVRFKKGLVALRPGWRNLSATLLLPLCCRDHPRYHLRPPQRDGEADQRRGRCTAAQGRAGGVPPAGWGAALLCEQAAAEPRGGCSRWQVSREGHSSWAASTCCAAPPAVPLAKALAPADRSASCSFTPPALVSSSLLASSRTSLWETRTGRYSAAQAGTEVDTVQRGPLDGRGVAVAGRLALASKRPRRR